MQHVNNLKEIIIFISRIFPIILDRSDISLSLFFIYFLAKYLIIIINVHLSSKSIKTLLNYLEKENGDST